MKRILPGNEVYNILTGEFFTYKGYKTVNSETLVYLDNEGQTHCVDRDTFQEFFIGVD